MTLPIAMTDGESTLLGCFLDRANVYIEYGSGGSTLLAAKKVKTSIISVDSSKEWLDRVRRHVSNWDTAPKLVFCLAEIGPTADWGYPSDATQRPKWPHYQICPWELPESVKADTVLIDGRFRVACFIESLLRLRTSSIILFHDFASRTHYHVARTLAREIARSGDLTAFVKPPDFKPEQALDLLAEYRFDPH